MSFLESSHCISRLNCSEFCLVNAEWRKRFGAPDVCPFGVTLEIAPALREKAIAELSKPKIRGLGDVVAKIAQPIASGFDSLLGTKLAKCGGCAERQAALNVVFPLQKAVQELTDNPSVAVPTATEEKP